MPQRPASSEARRSSDASRRSKPRTVGAGRSRRLLTLRDTARAMSGRRIVRTIRKLVAAFVLGLTFAFAAVFFTSRECESDCSWVADVFFEGNGLYFLLAACWVVA